MGGEEAFKKNQERDERKRRLSKENGVYLIEVLPGYKIGDLISEILITTVGLGDLKFDKMFDKAIESMKKGMTKDSKNISQNIEDEIKILKEKESL